jgi:hypothetical protein
MDASVCPTEFQFTTRDGERRTIHAIPPEDDLSAYHLLGSGTNVNFGLTFFSGFLHVPDFTERVDGFVVRRDKNAAMLEEIISASYVSVSFYTKEA